MRIATTLIVLGAVLSGAFALARAADEDTSPERMAKRIVALEMQVEYLRAREEAMTAYILRHRQRGADLVDGARRSRAAGFEMNRIPRDSRAILLAAMGDHGAKLAADLPERTAEQEKLLGKIRSYRKQHRLGGD